MAGREKERKTWRSTRTHTLAEIDECRGGVGKKLKVETKSAQDRSKGGGAETQRLSGSLFRAFFFRTCHSFVLFCLIIFKNLVQVSNITTTIHTTGTWSWKGAWIVNTADRGTYGRRLSRSWTCHGDCKTLRPGTWTRLVRDLLMCCLLSREFRNPHEWLVWKKDFYQKLTEGIPRMRILRVSGSEGALAPCYRAPKGHNQSQDIFLKGFFPNGLAYMWCESETLPLQSSECTRDLIFRDWATLAKPWESSPL